MKGSNRKFSEMIKLNEQKGTWENIKLEKLMIMPSAVIK